MDKIISLTQKQYEAEYKPQGYNILHIGATSSWRIEWGEWESIRDLIQNALDETESFTVETTGIDLIIKDSGTGLSIKDLFLGGQRAKEKHLRGKFGEGLKVAALALLRLGYGLEVKTVGRDIIFAMYEQDIENETISTLAAIWKPNNCIRGTTVTIRDYDFSKPNFDERFTQTADLNVLHKSKSQITKPIQRYNYIYKAKRGKATIYCRNIYMRDIDGLFSYDLWDFELSPDRHAPRYDFELWRNIAQLWQTVTDENLMTEFFKAIRDKTAKYLINDIDLDAQDYQKTPDGIPFYKIMESESEKWNRAFIKVFGEAAVLRTCALENEIEALGKHSVELPQGLMDSLEKCITTDKSLIESVLDKTKVVEVIEDKNLDPRQLLILNAARELTQALPKTPSGIFAAHLPLVEDCLITGTYHIPTNQILFALSTITSWDTMIRSLIHEAAHMIGNTEDCTRSHIEAEEYVSARLITFVANNSSFVQRYECIIK
jgi:hypothetical protein